MRQRRLLPRQLELPTAYAYRKILAEFSVNIKDAQGSTNLIQW